MVEMRKFSADLNPQQMDDDLLADLEDLGGGGGGGDEQGPGLFNATDIAGDVDMQLSGELLDIEKDRHQNITPMRTAADLRTLLHSSELQRLRQRITHTQQYDSSSFKGAVEDHPEYSLIVEANEMSMQLEDEITRVHRFLRDVYSARFPELESLIVNPVSYMLAVQTIGNDLNVSRCDEQLRRFLPPATVMVVNVTASTTKGRTLSEQQMHDVHEACDAVEQLQRVRDEITDYVQSRMNIVAPNLSAVIGSKTAALLMGGAGGLRALSCIPSCNIGMIGMSKRHLAGLSTSSTRDLHSGYVYQSPFIQSVGPDYRKRAMRVVTAKICLAVRLDSAREDTEGNTGKQFKVEIEKKLEKWQAPPPAPEIKPLVIAVDGPKKRRGGKRYRKQKEKFAVTELQKQQNRVQFGVAEEEILVFDETEGLGMLNQNTGLGKIRAATADPRVKVKTKASMQLQQQQQQQHAQQSSGATSGLASSLVFTPVQGLELVDPEAQKKKLKELNDKWFSGNQQFMHVKK